MGRWIPRRTEAPYEGGVGGPQGEWTVVGEQGPAGPAGAPGLTAEEVRDTIGATLVAGTNVTITVNDAGDTITIAASGGGGGLTEEQAQDIVGAMVTTSAPLSATYDDAAGTLTLTIAAASTSAAGSMSAADKTKLDGIAAGATANASDSALRDRATHTGTQAGSTVDAATTSARGTVELATDGESASGVVVQGNDARLSNARTPTAHNQTASTITDFAEAVDDEVAGLLVEGTAIDLTYNDVANTLTVAVDPTEFASDAIPVVAVNAAGLAEVVRDTMGSALVAGTNVTITPNDGADTITIAATGGGGGATITSALVAMTQVHPSELTATVSAAACTPSTPVMVSWGAVVDTDENDPDMDDVIFSALPGSGQFTLTATSRSTEPIRGSFRINYLIGA